MSANAKLLTTETQLSVFLVNKPGSLARVCQKLADDKINIVAISMMDATEHGVLRLVAEDAKRARESLEELNISTTETPVILTTMPNRPGALADMCERLASARIGVNYAYLTTGARGGKTLGVFRVTDVKKALTVLDERKPKRKPPATARR